MSEYVWYASYGSNISTERFLCYINGGKAIGAETTEEGCKDNSLPIKYENITINKKQYFAKQSRRWQNQGVAFLDDEICKEKTFGKMYLIKKDQFEDVVKQENRISVYKNLDCKLGVARNDGSAVIIPDTWYGRILFLGESGGYPIYTFTNTVNKMDETVFHPSDMYLQMIGRGLIENYKLDMDTLSDYFLKKDGVNLQYTIDDLKNILKVLY